jgi:hypothetical protein
MLLHSGKNRRFPVAVFVYAMPAEANIFVKNGFIKIFTIKCKKTLLIIENICYNKTKEALCYLSVRK